MKGAKPHSPPRFQARGRDIGERWDFTEAVTPCSNVNITLVWSTKYRKRVMTLPHEKEYCEQVMRRTAQEYGMNIQAIEVDEDHVHLYIEIPPQRSVGEGVRILKSVSARMMFKRFNYFKKKMWSGKLWGASYFARTVGEGVTAAMVKRYIEEHADKGLEPAQGELFPRSP